ncbi:MAG: rod shape-determining protein MreC [Clostridia bacterium]|nr:rod shape-determining protein MreC [Clostridia bacterium]
MRFFFRSRQFKIILSVVSGVLILSIILGIMGSGMAPGASLISAVTAPVRRAASEIFGSVGDFFDSMKENNKLVSKNAELEAEIEALRKEVADTQSLKEENELYKSFLGLKEDHTDFTMVDAFLVSRDSDDIFGSFVINKGSLSGIKKHDPVITGAGLIGYVSEVGITTSKVTTILSPDITLGALDVRTSDSGIVNGDYELAKRELCKITNLSRNCSVSVGDYIKTSGEGIFPEGILIGSVEKIGSDKYNSSIFAEVKPFVDIDSVKGVMVITDFAGKGGITVKSEGNKK